MKLGRKPKRFKRPAHEHSEGIGARSSQTRSGIVARSRPTFAWLIRTNTGTFRQSILEDT